MTLSELSWKWMGRAILCAVADLFGALQSALTRGHFKLSLECVDDAVIYLVSI